MKHFLVLSILTILISSCGSEKSEQDLLNELAGRREEQARVFRDALIQARKEEVRAYEEDLRERYSLNDRAPKKFAQKLCSGHDLTALFSKTALDNYKKEATCSAAEVIARTYPTLVTRNTDEQKKTRIFFWHFDEKGLVDSYEVVKGKLLVDHEMVAMNDGVKLSTFTFTKKINELETLLIRTPSYHHDLKRYVSYIKLATNAGLNVVIQENRGARHSQGIFRFMHKHNIKDAANTIKWIESRSDLNKNTVAFGEGYDAFNALAAGLNRLTNLRSVISCSAPWHMNNQKYTFDMLKFTWLSETSLPIENFEQHLQALLLKGVPLERLDNLTFGRDITDYEDFLSASDDQAALKKYWSSRRALNRVRTIKTPTTHVGGLSSDPTSQGIFGHYNKWKINNKHRYYLHKESAGCGDIFTSRYLRDYLKGSSQRPIVSRYFKTKNKQISLSSINQNIRYEKVFIDFKKPDLFGLFPGIETLFGFSNVTALRLNSLGESIQTDIPSLSSKRIKYMNGPILYNISVASQIGRDQSFVSLEMLLDNKQGNRIAIAPFSLSKSNNRKQERLTISSLSALAPVSDKLQYQFVLKNKLSTEVLLSPKQLRLFNTPSSIRENIMAIPAESEKPYMMVPIEAI